jgi:hypothetical protein
MRTISAKILDPTHLELSEPLQAAPGETISVSIPTEVDDDMAAWRDAGKRRLLDAYADEDAVYDDL